MDSKQKEVRQIIASMRGGVFTKPAPASQAPEPDAGFSFLATRAEMDILLRIVYTSCITMPHEPVPSPRPGIGRVITSFKKILLRLIRPLVSMLLQPQIDFNENLADYLKLLDSSVKHLTIDSQRLYAEHDALRLWCEKLEAENARLKKENESPLK